MLRFLLRCLILGALRTPLTGTRRWKGIDALE